MGIKGRRKKLREREARERAAAAGREQGPDLTRGGEECNESAWDLHGGSGSGDGGELIVMGDGPFRPPVDAMGRLKMKKSELFRLQDEAYLDHMREEHSGRRQSHARPAVSTTSGSGEGNRKRPRGGLDADAVADLAAAEAERVAREYLISSRPADEPGVDSTVGACGTHTALNRCGGDGGRGAAEAEQRAHRSRAGGGARYRHPLMGLDPIVVAALEAEGFRRMTRIQERAIPYALEGYDLLGQARTGSGKTLAFAVPVLHACREAVRRGPSATLALMLAPTKELCVQTHDVIKSVCDHIPASAARFTLQLITGGTKVTEERKRLVAGPSIVVGTPGRVRDHAVHCKGWGLSRLRFLILDEADRMLADGFQRDLDAILAKLPKARQTFLFSATNSKSVHDLARLSLAHQPLFIDTVGDAPHPIELTEYGVSGIAMPAAPVVPYRRYTDVKSSDTDGSDGSTAASSDEEVEEGVEEEDVSDASGEGFSDSEVRTGSDGDSDDRESHDSAADDREEAIPSTLRQFCHIVSLEDRLRSLYVFVKRVARTSKAMVFCSTVASTTFHFQMMGSVGFHDEVMMLHGHMKHRQRVQAFQLFRQWQTGVLFCTDVAARGLDIPNVEWILQYDPPLDPTEYIHRIGRTARAGNVGSALLFLAPEEAAFIKYLSKFGIALERYTEAPERLPRIQEQLERVLQLDEVVAKSAVTAFRAHVGAYQSHILKETFSVHRLDLDRLAVSFALTTTPHVTLPKNAAEERKREYVKGKLKSLNRRKLEALKHYERFKVKPQWEDGSFVGVMKPTM